MTDFREAFDAILDHDDLTAVEKLVALGILRHANENLAESHPGGAALARYASVKRRETIAAAIRSLKEKRVISNRHDRFSARVFRIDDEGLLTAEILAFRATLRSVRPTPPVSGSTVQTAPLPCPVQPDNSPSPVSGSTVQTPPAPCPVQADTAAVNCTVQPDKHVSASTVQIDAPSLPKRSEGKGEGETDLFGGRGPVVGVSYPSALMRALEKGSAPVAASALEDAVRAQLKAGAPPEDIEGAMRKAVAHAEDRKETTPSGLLKTAVSFVENAKRFADERKKADAARAASAAPRRALVIPNGKVEPLQPVAWEP